MKYKSNRNIIFSCSYHVVFCPKYRRPVLVDGVDERFKEIAREVADELGVETLATLSDGRKIGNPRHLKKYERKLAREQRRLSRRKGTRRGEKPSGRYLKQRKWVARIHAKRRSLMPGPIPSIRSRPCSRMRTKSCAWKT